MHKVHKFLTVAGSLGGGGVVVGRGADGGVAGSDAISAPKETSLSPSSCGIAPIRSASTRSVLSTCRLDWLWTLPLDGQGRRGQARNRPRTVHRSHSDHILPGSGVHAPRCCLGCGSRSCGCRQRRHCGLAVGGHNCCSGRWCSFRSCCCTLP